ncbi:SDR family NAD(P)-dependent oxidoreductase [Microbacterium sp. Root553]|uniref:SDR family NAD(P)-dependent oxidoreductase n=1 Tax=Microbacterium sp. Root553 TaxID=1736556 RepID=UPI0006F6E7FD|nr:SDR family NAD(P)-dependent oxidoreductase [Microbacterium sp. Root553]KQZ23546.1 short-chain dehydrogenase [Microbacterium sp. Root553]
MTSPQRWFITGGSRGLGRALTTAALDAGHAVVATVRGDHALPDHDRLTVLTLDVRDRDAAHETVRRAADLLGGIDVLVNNAGYGMIGALEEASEEDARAIVDTNLLGPLWLSQAVIPIMRRQGGGHIVQISTVGAVGTMPMLGLYNSTKWGLEAFSEAMAAEVERFGIRVSLIEPGALDTEWADASMRFSSPLDAYDAQRIEMFGTTEVPWPAGESSGGTAPEDAAGVILVRVAAADDPRLRVLVGDDAPAQVAAALDLRQKDYALDPRFPTA